MLISLQIRNLAVVEEAELSFSPGLTVLTGETGAGKSLVVDALSLLLGARASSDAVRAGEARAELSAVFRADEACRAQVAEAGLGEGSDVLLRREIVRGGGGRAWVNGQLATAALLSRIAGPMLDLHGQHEHQSLLSAANQLALLDRVAGVEQACAKFGEAAEAFRARRSAREALAAPEDGRERRLDYLRHQASELESAAASAADERSLRDERARLASVTKLTELARRAQALLSGGDEVAGAVSALQEAEAALRQAASLDPACAPVADAVAACASPAADAAREVRSYAESLAADPARLDEIEARLSLYERLCRKHGTDVGGLVGVHARLQEELDGLEHSADRLAAMGAELAERARELSASSRALSERREAAAAKLAKRVERELAELAMQRCGFRVSVRRHPEPDSPVDWGDGGLRWTRTGCDSVEFLISPNPGEEFVALSRAASGGELSRIMLALKTVLAGADPVSTLVFDEVDAGVSGGIAAVVGRKLSLLAASRQVLCVTHLPQVAAFADAHLRVSKETEAGRTYTRVAALSPEERAEELARMLSGLTVTEAARAQARELLRQREAAGKSGRARPGHS